MTLVVPSPVRTTSLTIKKDRSGKYKNTTLKPPTVAQLINLSETMAISLTGMSDPRRPGSGRVPVSITAPMSLENYAKLLGEIKTYNTLVEKKWSPNLIRRLGTRLSEKLSLMVGDVDVARSMSTYYQYAANPSLKNIRFVTKPRDIYTELMAVCKTFETRWYPNLGSLGVITPPITVVHPVVRGLRYNFGPMIIHVGPNYSTNAISPHTPRWSRGRVGEYFHPHVRGGNRGSLCRGEGGTAIARAEKEGRYFDVVDMIIAVLSTYGSNPYIRIDEWNGVCDEKFNPDTGHSLSADEDVPPEPARPTSVCSGCGVTHDNPVSCFTGECQYQSVCIGCLTRCQGHMPDGSRCNQWFCEDHVWICSDCGQHLCNSHFTLDESGEVCDACYSEQEED